MNYTQAIEKSKNFKHEYMMLGRLRSDLDYFFGAGRNNEKQLYYGRIEEHYKEFVKLWKLLPIKPEWLRATEIIEYKKKIHNFLFYKYESKSEMHGAPSYSYQELFN